MDLQLKDRLVLVTGGTRGIGLACAQAFLREGCRVTIVGSRPESVGAALQTLAAEHGERADGVCVDLGQRGAVAQLRERLGNVDVLVNNAGAIPGGGLERVDDETWRAAWELKVYGYLDTTRAALPAMMARGAGVIVNVIGIAGAAPRYDYLCGSMANAALISFTEALGAHSNSRGVRVLGVNPGPTETDRLVTLARARAKERFGDESQWPQMLSHLPFGRATRADEIADLVVFLASPRASYLSGVVVDADGGALYASH
ncbi:short-chain dehydrogenase [Burkholderia sp. WAC0059]|uniref:short-chain dehydrogenase/reductase n=1 Tax=Burkholderia sp. WAC0059 TaxID=2066022 RepID=UPI000C7F0C30|nr:short-chain dehydrogenase/reductase [Burkholderia sp. WAC0059]PLZ00149.1 short-chain dehydrogenase [Burkholderia sp. WAC0059]